MTTDTNYGSTFSAIQTHLSSLHNPRLTSWTQPLCEYGGKREMNRGATAVSSRWNPTAEQVQALEEMYRRGTRTPSAEQIQHITAELRRFGKIEGKNVFYWFQNHKARDRHKKRSQVEFLAGKNETPFPKGLRGKYKEMEHHEKLPTMSKCSTSKVQKYDEGEVLEELKRDRVTSIYNSNSCRNLDLSSCSFAMHKIAYQESNLGQKNGYNYLVKLQSILSSSKNDGIKENTTLELFPVRGSDLSITLCSCSSKEEDDALGAGSRLIPNQFFEFLPTKN